MSSSQNYVTADMLLRTAYAMIAVTTLVFVARTATRIWRPKPLAAEDYILLLAYLLFLSTTITYIVVTPYMYRISDVTLGKAPPYAEILDDSLFMIKIFFANTMLFWFALWAVKFAFLALYYRLMTGLRRYMQLWWIVTGFCVITLIGCVVSNFTSCHSMHAWFNPGECTTPRDVRAQIASLYYAFAVDVISDLLIMFLPIGLIWNLQRPLVQRIGMGILFGIGWTCIAMAIVRVVQIGSKAQSSSTPSSSWLALWAIIESAVAVIVGCGPGLYSTAKEVRTTRKATYGGSSGPRFGYGSNEGYRRQPSASAKFPETELKSFGSMPDSTSKRGHKKVTSMDVLDYGRSDAASSQEELTIAPGRIQVKHAVEVNSVDVDLEANPPRLPNYSRNW